MKYLLLLHHHPDSHLIPPLLPGERQPATTPDKAEKCLQILLTEILFQDGPELQDDRVIRVVAVAVLRCRLIYRYSSRWVG